VEVDLLVSQLQPKEVAATQENASIAGKAFVITGTLSKPREYFQKLIEDAGGKVSGSVSKKTHFLLAGENAGSKLAKAAEAGVTVLDETQFEALVAG
jgi:DNA ligase (NAD+)